MDVCAGDQPSEDAPVPTAPSSTASSVPGASAPIQKSPGVPAASIATPQATASRPTEEQPSSAEASPSKPAAAEPAADVSEPTSGKPKKKLSSWFSTKKKADKPEGASGGMSGRLPTAGAVAAATGAAAAVTGVADTAVTKLQGVSSKQEAEAEDAPDEEFKEPVLEAPVEPSADDTSKLAPSQLSTDDIQKPASSKPTVQEGGWTMYTQTSSQQTFSWPTGMKVPQGTMTHDGTPVPEDAEPQPDGTLKLPTGSVIPAEGVVLPDGLKIIDVMKPTGEAPKPVASMPDGSKPSQQGGWEWTKWSTAVPSANVMDAPLVSEQVVPKTEEPSKSTSPSDVLSTALPDTGFVTGDLPLTVQ